MVRFRETFSMLFSRPYTPENQHKTFSCNFFGVMWHIYPTNTCKKKTFKDLGNIIEVRDRSEVRKVAGVKVGFFE